MADGGLRCERLLSPVICQLEDEQSSMASMLENVEHAEGISIYGGCNANGTWLTSTFASLESVAQFELSGINVEDVSWLQGIKMIGSLVFSYSSGFTNFTGAEELREVQFLDLYGTDVTTFAGLSGLEKIHEGFNVGDASALVNLNGLDSLRLVGGIHVYNAQSLENIKGLSNVASVDTIEITDNPVLTTLDGCEKMTVTGEAHVHTNVNLMNISALPESSVYGVYNAVTG